MDEYLPLLLSCPDAGKRLGVSVETVKKMIALGSIEPVYVHPKAWPRVRRADVEALAWGDPPTRKKASP
jgi:hypothetical protein